MDHLKSFNAFYEQDANLRENQEEESSDTLYESITERAFGDLVRNEGCLLEHTIDDAFLQDVGDLAQVNENGRMEHADKSFSEMLECFNSYYTLNLPMPNNPRAVFESLSDWYEQNEENITPEQFEEKFTEAVNSENDTDDMQDGEVEEVHEEELPTASNDDLAHLMAKAPGTLSIDEFIKISSARNALRKEDMKNPEVKKRYAALHSRWTEEVIAKTHSDKRFTNNRMAANQLMHGHPDGADAISGHVTAPDVRP